MAIALGVLAVATIHVGTFMIVPDGRLGMFGYVVVGAAFLVGVVLVVGSLEMKVPRRWSFWCAHALALAILAGVFCFYFFGGSLIDLLHYRTSLVLALTGGQDELHSWAAEILAQPREPAEYEGAPCYVDRQHWSRQVRWLRPSKVTIMPMFKDGQEGVVLDYDVPHEITVIVIGPPGAVPPEDSGSAYMWLRFGDGLYFWSS
ncbi:MAG: hypothetical protein JW993_20275 [Sedimentisphaerales bacterium]|nr:hypothetical protein [Sedimentisphaerales bacterium]